MKKFEDLVFKDHPNFDRAQQALLEFDNGYGVSVLLGARFYSNGRDTYEVAVMYDDAVTYPMETDVVGFLKADEVTAYMEKVQDLPPVSNTNKEMGDIKFTTAGDMMNYVYPGSDCQE